MHYRVLLKILKVLIYIKRLFWWVGAKISFILAKLFTPIWRFFGFIHYKTSYFLKKINDITGFEEGLVKRDNLQIIIFIILLVVALPQTKLYAKKGPGLPGQKTIAYSLTPAETDYSVEEIEADQTSGYDSSNSTPDWRSGALAPEQFNGPSSEPLELGTPVAGGMALSKPAILPGVSATGGRQEIVDYIVEAGDSLGSIASKFLISVNTLLWENNLTTNSYLHPGDRLRILPVTGISHVVKRGDTLSKIAALYNGTVQDIVRQNQLKPDGSDLVAGEKIIIPNGVKLAKQVAITPPKSVVRVATPPGSRQVPSVSGFVWPSAAHVVTQYFTWQHHGVDIAGGSFSTPNYAAKAGVVIKSQCGWNSGYGCEVIIDHGGGIKTLYGHNSKLLVSVGEHVEAGQTIGLMGNTGNVRGRTGIHLHFEVWVNNVRTNPFQFVR